MHLLKKLSKPKDLFFEDKFFVFDTETYGLECTPEKLAFGVIYGHNYIKILKTPEEFKKEFKKEIYNNKKIFAHNAEYDLSAIFGNVITEVDNSAIFNGKFISCSYGKTKFCDSSNIYPVSLENIGLMMGYEKGITPDKFINPEKYSKEEKNISSDDINYCIRDCKILYNALLSMFNRVQGIRMTVASTAMYYFRSEFLKKNIPYSDLNYDFFESYYGGRTEAFFIGKCDGDVYDINSLYPYIMTETFFPDFKNLKRIDSPDRKLFDYHLKSKEGFAKVTIYHKKTNIGYLPFKCEKTNKLLFPNGKFTTTVNFNELLFAIQSGVVEILKVHHYVYGAPIESPFKEYVHKIYNERKTSKDEILRLILKFLLNSLYGKFGMKEKFQTTYYKRIPYKEIERLKLNNEYYELKLFSSVRNDCFLVTENKQTKFSYFAIPSIASYITSAARLKLLKGMLSVKYENLLYCDTDSMFLNNNEKPNIELSNELGAWKLEDKKITETRGLKNYSYIEDGKHHDAIKGVSKNSIEVERFKFRTKKYIKTKEALRRKLKTGEAIVKEKVIKNTYDKRIVNKNGTTKSIYYER